MPHASLRSRRARVRAAGLVLPLVATAIGAAGVAGAATSSSDPPARGVERHRSTSSRAVLDDRNVDELTARASIARRKIAIERLQKLAVEQAVFAGAAQAEALRAQQAAATSRRVAMWDRLAPCETGGDWHNGGDYGGGLGIYIGTWRAYGGEEFAPRPQLATKEQQIIVAERIAQDGFGGWGCAEAVGLPT